MSSDGLVYKASTSFARPADTTSYTAGDLIADNVVGSSVTPLSFALQSVASRPMKVKRAFLNKSTSVTANAAFLLHLYSVSPTQSVSATGDNGAILPAAATLAGYLGSISVTTDKRSTSSTAVGWGAATVGSEPVVVPSTAGTTIFGLLEATAAYAPGNAETFAVTLEAYLQ